MKLDHLLIPHTRINSKWIKDLNVIHETIKVLEENISSKSRMLLIAMFFLISSGKGNKRKINKWDYNKLKSFCTAKETINKIKRQPTEWENILADTSHNRFISKIYKELTILYTKKNSVKKWAKNWNKCFSKEDILMANRHLKRSSTY